MGNLIVYWFEKCASTNGIVFTQTLSSGSSIVIFLHKLNKIYIYLVEIKTINKKYLKVK